MNPNIEHLYSIAAKSKRLIIGLMSGTSLDGLDIALCSFEGSGSATKTTVLQFETIPYSEDLKKDIGSISSKKNIGLEKLCLLNPWIAHQHAGFINACLKKWGIRSAEIDCIASHGQTVYHAPVRLHQHKKFGNATLQIGDGDHLAVATGIIVISDFRQKHIAAGGEGAPLAAYGDKILFNQEGEDRILLNIGGIANFTYLPGAKENDRILCTDTGPGNTLMDAFVQKYFPGKYFDEEGSLANQGHANNDLLTALKEHPFFDQVFPKTTGAEIFNLALLDEAKQRSKTRSLSAEDTMATLNKFSADTIVTAIQKCTENKTGLKIFVSGGGIHNPVLMKYIKDQLPGCAFDTTAVLGIDPGAKEAILFAVLANECLAGNNKSIKGVPAISMGKISFPI